VSATRTWPRDAAMIDGCAVATDASTIAPAA